LYGPFNPANDNLRDMNGREIFIAISLVVLFFIIGLRPNFLFDKINPATAELIETTPVLAER
jgi:NADH:ubiquinone oxidoreductase subunit 4 (subunit M)